MKVYLKNLLHDHTDCSKAGGNKNDWYDASDFAA